MEDNREASVRKFLELVKASRRGKLKIYIGMSAGVGKTYRMLLEAHTLLRNNVDLQIAYVETHGRAETEQLLTGLPLIPRKKIFYKGKELEEMDLQEVLARHPEIVMVDELAHTNAEGSKNEKRWQDVADLLDAGINVISAINVQHIESLNTEAEAISGVRINERVPDRLLELADEIVNIDLTAEELLERLKQGRIYDRSRISMALNNFFRPEKILQLRELALREVARHLEKKISSGVHGAVKLRPERFMACISTNKESAKNVIRKTARLASSSRAQWIALHVETAKEHGQRIPLATQRHLINNFKLAVEMGAEVLRVKNKKLLPAILEEAKKRSVTSICISAAGYSVVQALCGALALRNFLKHLRSEGVDLIILS